MKEDLILNQLIELTIDKKYEEIKNVLQMNGHTSKYKGDLLEKYIEELYKGNGWICRRVGGKNDRGADLLLSHPNNPNKILHILQAKNHNKPLTFKETRSELIQFEEVTSILYDCYDYQIISLNGYAKSTDEISKLEKLKNFNISLYDFEDLKSLIDHYDKDKLNPNPILTLYAHNENAYKNVLRDWKNCNHTSVIHATGTGKSKVFMKLAGEHFYNKPKLILAPSNYILNQFKNDKDNWALDNTTYMTYAKLSRLSTDDIKKLNASLVCVDEFHRCGAKVWSEKVHTLMQHLDKNDSKILGLTATPVRASSDKKNMIEELFNGRMSSSISIQDAIIKNILPMPKYVSALYTLEEETDNLIKKINDSEKSIEEKEQLTNEVNNININWENTQGVVEILKKHINFKDGKGIVFCESIDHLNEMEETVRRWFKRAGFNIKTNSVHSKNEYNSKELDDFKNNTYKNTIHLLFSVNSLNEGIHFGNSIKFTIFLRKTTSEIVYLQQLGRVLQADHDEHPIVFDLVCNFKNINSTPFYSSFSDTIKNTNLIRASLNLNKIRTTEEYIKSYIYDECKEIQEVLSNIRNNLRRDWEQDFNELKELYLIHGEGYLKMLDGNERLSNWINNQRRAKRKNTLPVDRIEKLDSIKFIWDPIESYWEQKYLELKSYYLKYKTTNIPQKYPPNPSLGKWVNNQRNLYKKNGLSKYKIDKLNQLNFIWDIQEATWLDYVERFKAFYEINNHGNVPQKYKDDPSLGNWVSNQRKVRKRGLLSPEKIKILDAAGFIWDTRHPNENSLLEKQIQKA